MHYFHPIRAHTTRTIHTCTTVYVLYVYSPSRTPCTYTHGAHRGRTPGRVPARSRVGVARPRTLDAARRHSPRRVDGRSPEDTGRGRRCASNAADALDRSRGGGRARGRARARKGIISPRARAVYPRAREGNGVERGERRGDARGGVVCRRCLALERERWEVKDEDER